MEFNYLGVNISSSGNLVKEIKTQPQKAARVAGCLNDLFLEKQLYEKGNKIKNIQGNRKSDYDT